MTDSNMELARKRAMEAVKNIGHLDIKMEESVIQQQTQTQQLNQKYNDEVKEQASSLANERAKMMARLAQRNSDSPSSQISPDVTPTKNASAGQQDKGATLSEEVADRLDAPQEVKNSVTQFSLEDVKSVGKDLQEAGVREEDISQNQQNEGMGEKGFDKNAGSSKALQQQEAARTSRVIKEAKEKHAHQQATQNSQQEEEHERSEQKQKSNSQSWGK